MKYFLTFFIFGLFFTGPTASYAQLETVSVHQMGMPSDFYQWCTQNAAFLARKKQQAAQDYRVGNFVQAKQTLIYALNQAQARLAPHYSNTQSYQALIRANNYIRIIEGQASGVFEARLTSFFLLGYFDLIIDFIKEVDMVFYRSGCGHRCQRQNQRHFEHQFIYNSQKQIQVVMNTLLEKQSNRHSTVYYPVGNSKVYLNVLESALAGYITDLSTALSTQRYSCLLMDLHSVYDRLVSFNSNGLGYANDFQAVQNATHRLVSLTQVIGRQTPCGGTVSPMPRKPQIESRNILAGRNSIILENGTARTIRLPRRQFVKNLIISAEGIRRNALFEVVINGKVKGTIHVPGVDPTYFVTVQEETASIEFISRTGRARISSIIVVGH